MQLPEVARPTSQFLWASMTNARASGTPIPSCRYGTRKHRQLAWVGATDTLQGAARVWQDEPPRSLSQGNQGREGGAHFWSLSSDALQLLGTGVYSWRAQAQGSCPGVVTSKVPQLVRNCPGAGQQGSSVSGQQQDTTLRSGQVATGQLQPA